REVDDVEAELRELRQDRLDAPEPAERSREELVPRAEATDLAVDLDRERLAAGGAVLVGHRRRKCRLEVEVGNPEQHAPLGKLARQILLAGLDLTLELVAEGREAVGPRLDRVLPRAALRHLERAREQVVVDELEGHRAPAARARPAVEDVGGEQVVAVAEHLRRDLDLLPDGVLGRMAPAVDLRPDALDANTRLRLGQLRAHNHADDVDTLERRAA